MTLSKAEQLELGRRIRSGDKAARETMIVANMPLVKWTIRRYFKWNSDEMFDDMKAAGYVGLCKAVDRYDPDFNCTVSGIAVLHIKNEITDFVHQWDGTDRRGRDIPIITRRDEIERRMTAGETPDDIARGIPHKNAKRMPFTGQHMLKILRSTSQRVSMTPLVERAISARSEHPETAIMTEITLDQLKREISKLKPATRAIFELLLEGHSQREIATKTNRNFTAIGNAYWQAVFLIRRRLKVEVRKAA